MWNVSKQRIATILILGTLAIAIGGCAIGARPKARVIGSTASAVRLRLENQASVAAGKEVQVYRVSRDHWRAPKSGGGRTTRLVGRVRITEVIDPTTALAAVLEGHPRAGDVVYLPPQHRSAG